MQRLHFGRAPAVRTGSGTRPVPNASAKRMSRARSTPTPMLPAMQEEAAALIAGLVFAPSSRLLDSC
jgi:hypothetical protein